MFIQVALANVSREVSTDDLLRFLANEVPKGAFFKFQPPPGGIAAATFDFRAILYDTAAIATIATALWGVYDKFIRPIHDKAHGSNSAIVIQMKNEVGESDQFIIGGDIKDKEILIKRFQDSAKRLNLDSPKNVPREELEEIQSSGYWIKIK